MTYRASVLCEDQHVVWHRLRLKSKILRSSPQATFIAFKLIIVSEFRERVLYSWRRSLLHIKSMNSAQNDTFCYVVYLPHVSTIGMTRCM